MNIIYKKCVDLFEIESEKNPIIPLINFRFQKKRRFEKDRGFGIYVFKFNNKIIYIGSYCNGKSGVTVQRWWTHLASITSRFRENNFLTQTKPYLNKITDDNLIIKFLDLKKQKFIENFENSFTNPKFKLEIFDNLLKVKHTDKDNINLLLGNGNCRTSINRVRCSNIYWDEFRLMSKDDLLNNFSFTFFQLDKNNNKFISLLEFLYSDYYDINFRKKFFRNFIEDSLINKLKPIANEINSIKEFNLNNNILNSANDFSNSILDEIT